jgi:cell division inhibitor SulA/protein ImuA
MDPTRLDELLQHPSLWRASSAQGGERVLPTGFRRLDERLPGGGWPLDTLIELLLPLHGIGEINLLLPALRALCAQDERSPRWIAWLGPPHLPYAPALASAGLDPARMLVVRSNASKLPGSSLWAMEQALRSRACVAALGWVDGADGQSLRRLKLAAEEGGSIGFLFRPRERAREPSPATLRLLLEAHDGALDVQILKSRGGLPGKVKGVLGGAAGG